MEEHNKIPTPLHRQVREYEANRLVAALLDATAGSVIVFRATAVVPPQKPKPEKE